MDVRKKVIAKILIIIAIIILILTICVISKIKLYTYNPIRAAIGYISVKVFDKDYIYVQNIPNKTIYANDKWNFNEYMLEKGYVEIVEEQLGQLRVFTNGETKQHIFVIGYNVYEFDKETIDNSGISIETRKENYEEQISTRNKSLEWMVNVVNE